MLLSSGDDFPHLIQKRGSQLVFVTYLLNYPRNFIRCSMCVFALCVFIALCVCCFMYVFSLCVCLLYVCVAGFTLDAKLLARSQYSEGPATGHLDTGFSWFPCVYKQVLRWLPSFQVATTCFSCSPPDLNLNLSLKLPSCFVYM